MSPPWLWEIWWPSKVISRRAKSGNRKKGEVDRMNPPPLAVLPALRNYVSSGQWKVEHLSLSFALSLSCPLSFFSLYSILSLFFSLTQTHTHLPTHTFPSTDIHFPPEVWFECGWLSEGRWQTVHRSSQHLFTCVQVSSICCIQDNSQK